MAAFSTLRIREQRSDCLVLSSDHQLYNSSPNSELSLLKTNAYKLQIHGYCKCPSYLIHCFYYYYYFFDISILNLLSVCQNSNMAFSLFRIHMGHLSCIPLFLSLVLCGHNVLPNFSQLFFELTLELLIHKE